MSFGTTVAAKPATIQAVYKGAYDVSDEEIEELSNKGMFLVGGSADLEPSNVTAGFAKLVGDFSATNPEGMILQAGKS